MQRKKVFFKGALTGAIAALLLLALGFWVLMDFGWGALSIGEMQKLAELRNIIDEAFLWEVDEETLANGLYDGYMQSLNDDYAEYYSPKEMEALMREFSGELIGVGALLSQEIATGEVTVTEVIKNSPAEKAGMQAGDILYQVDGQTLEGLDLNAIIDLIVGENGTSVEIAVFRGEERQKVTLTAIRDKVEFQTVTYQMLDNDLAYLHISEFTANTNSEFAEAIQALQSQNMQGLIIDLRNNPGGDLDAVSDVADQLLPEGLIVYTEDKNGQRIDYRSDAERQLTLPMAVLINNDSASASEILAGALQDYGQAVIVGTQSFGKGIVQELYVFDDGSGVKLTTSEYYTPKGRNIHGLGITPDVAVTDAADSENAESDLQLTKAVELLKESLRENQ